jgi:hypothetical protein
VGFVVDKVALGRVFSDYFGFPCQSSFHQLLHNHPHLSSGADTMGQKWSQYKGLSPTPLAIKRRYHIYKINRDRLHMNDTNINTHNAIFETLQALNTREHKTNFICLYKNEPTT